MRNLRTDQASEVGEGLSPRTAKERKADILVGVGTVMGAVAVFAVAGVALKWSTTTLRDQYTITQQDKANAFDPKDIDLSEGARVLPGTKVHPVYSTELHKDIFGRDKVPELTERNESTGDLGIGGLGGTTPDKPVSLANPRQVDLHTFNHLGWLNLNYYREDEAGKGNCETYYGEFGEGLLASTDYVSSDIPADQAAYPTAFSAQQLTVELSEDSRIAVICWQPPVQNQDNPRVLLQQLDGR